jgi:hypothetical protein
MLTLSRPSGGWARLCAAVFAVAICVGGGLARSQANAAPNLAVADGDRVFLLDVKATEIQVSYRGECDVTDAMGTMRSKPITGYSGDQRRFVGTRIVCRLHNPTDKPFAVTLRYSDGRVAASAQGGTLTVAAQ